MSPLGFALLAVFVFLLFSRLCDFYFWKLHIPLFFSCCSLVAALFTGNLLTPLGSRIGLFLMLFTAWLLLATPFSIWRGGSYVVAVDEWSKSLAVFFVVSALTLTLSHVAKIIHTVAYAMLVAALIALKFGILIAGRLAHPTGSYSGPNELASAMLIGTIYTWFLISNSTSSGLRRTCGLLMLPPLLYVMIRTGSRSGMVALGVVFLFLLKRYSAGVKVIMVLGLVFVVVMAAVVLPSHVLTRYVTLFSEHVDEAATEADMSQQQMTVGSSQTRLHLFLTSLKLTIMHPLFGVGPGQFMVAENNVAIRDGRPIGTWLGTHNTYTEISSECGIPALIFYLCCMFYCYKELATVEREGKRLQPRGLQVIPQILSIAFVLKMVLLAYAVFYMFEHIAYSPILPCLAGLILAFGRAAKWEFTKIGSATAAAPAVA